MPKRSRIPSGVEVLDKALEGGLSSSDILQIYGPGGVGKTTLALQFAINSARKKYPVFYFNMEGKFPVVRLKQMSARDFSHITPLITVVSPESFREQGKLITQLDSLIPSAARLLIFDTIVSHYRKEYGPITDNVLLNRRLNQQFGMIASLARSRPISVIVINQVRGDINGEVNIQPVANSVVSYWSTISLQITRAESKGYREFKLVKVEGAEPISFVLNLQSSGFR